VPIGENELLQANATIIAGVLILLTISSIAETSPALKNSTETKGIAEDFRINLFARILIILTIAPFAASIVILMLMKDNDKEKIGLKPAKLCTIIGVLYITGTVLYLLAVRPF
jgi:hypothetical protein